MTLTLSDFYSLPTLFTLPNPILFLLHNGYLRELSTVIPNYQTVLNFSTNNSNISINVHKSLQANLNSIMPLNQWQQASVWFNNTPCMIIRNTTPILTLHQDDYPKHFITDTSAHKSMLYYILSLFEEDNIIDKSVRNQGVWNKENLFPDKVTTHPLSLSQPQVYDLQLAQLVINL